MLQYRLWRASRMILGANHPINQGDYEFINVPKNDDKNYWCNARLTARFPLNSGKMLFNEASRFRVA